MCAASTRRYFDNAATSFPKPPGVARAMLEMLSDIGAPGRGTYAEARHAASILFTCRQRIARLVNLTNSRGEWSPNHVIFAHNTTDALNLAIKGALRHARRERGPSAPLHIVSTAMEHNSVLRPMHALKADDPLLNWTTVPADPATGIVNPVEVASHIRPVDTVAVIINHASNVTGTIQDIGAISRLVKAASGSTLVIVDGAQSLGHVPVDMLAMGIDLLAFPGHKGLLGPTGTGGLCIRPGIEHRLCTFREGGTGNVSETQTHPDMLPEKYEAGSHNTVGIAGLSEGVAWLLERGIDQVRSHELALTEHMLTRLRSPDLHPLSLLGPTDPKLRVGVFSLVHPALPPAELSALLETEFGILSRSGLHCAPIAHETCGHPTPHRRHSGACRLSLGPFLSLSDVDFACDALTHIVSDYHHAARQAPAATTVVSPVPQN